MAFRRPTCARAVRGSRAAVDVANGEERTTDEICVRAALSCCQYTPHRDIESSVVWQGESRTLAQRAQGRVKYLFVTAMPQRRQGIGLQKMTTNRSDEGSSVAERRRACFERDAGRPPSEIGGIDSRMDPRSILREKFLQSDVESENQASTP